MTTTTSRLISLITGTPLFPAIQFAGKRTPFHSSTSSLRFYRRSFCSSSAVLDAAISSHHQHHPWPEWVSFVDRLSSKGYLAKEEDEGNDVVLGDVYKDMNLLKDVCLAFARDRFDIFNFSLCNYLNFSRNVICRECKDKAPRKFGGVDVEMKKGDCICPDCNFMNFSRNIKCLKCSTKGPTRVSVEDVEMKKGDWNCTQCGFMNFAGNVKCLRCREQHPKRELNPGAWECPSCDFLNYRKNVICRKCNVDSPKDHVEPQYEDQIWSRPSRQ